MHMAVHGHPAVALRIRTRCVKLPGDFRQLPHESQVSGINRWMGHDQRDWAKRSDGVHHGESPPPTGCLGAACRTLAHGGPAASVLVAGTLHRQDHSNERGVPGRVGGSGEPSGRCRPGFPVAPTTARDRRRRRPGALPLQVGGAPRTVGAAALEDPPGTSAPEKPPRLPLPCRCALWPRRLPGSAVRAHQGHLSIDTLGREPDRRQEQPVAPSGRRGRACCVGGDRPHRHHHAGDSGSTEASRPHRRDDRGLLLPSARSIRDACKSGRGGRPWD